MFLLELDRILGRLWPTRREFLGYLGLGTGVLGIYIATKPINAATQLIENPTPLEAKETKQIRIYHSDITLPSIVEETSCYSRLEMSVSEAEYSSNMKVYKKSNNEEIFSIESEGMVRNRTLLPKESSTKMRVKLKKFRMSYTLQEDFTFKFEYDENNNLIKLTKTSAKGNSEVFDAVEYKSHTDYLTAALQKLLDLEIGKIPTEVQFVSNKGLPIDGTISFAADFRAATVNLGPDFYFDSLKIAFTDGRSPESLLIENIKVPIPVLGIKILVGDIEAIVTKIENLP